MLRVIYEVPRKQTLILGSLRSDVIQYLNFPDESVSSRINQGEQTLAEMYIARSSTRRLRLAFHASSPFSAYSSCSFSPPFWSIITKQRLRKQLDKTVTRASISTKGRRRGINDSRSKETSCLGFLAEQIITFGQNNIADDNNCEKETGERERERSIDSRTPLSSCSV